MDLRFLSLKMSFHYQLRYNYAKDIASRVRETYGSKISIFENVIPLSVKVAEASAEGKSIYCHCPVRKEKVFIVIVQMEKYLWLMKI